MKVSIETIARTICLGLALLNQGLAFFGRDRLPFVENDVYQFITLFLTLATSAVSWWKNNSFTKAAIKADKYMKCLKKNNTEEGE